MNCATYLQSSVTHTKFLGRTFVHIDSLIHKKKIQTWIFRLIPNQIKTSSPHRKT